MKKKNSPSIIIPVHPILPKHTLLIYHMSETFETIIFMLLKSLWKRKWKNSELVFIFFFQVILTDCTNKRLYLSSDEGLTWSRIDIPFPPDTLVLHPSEPGWILGFSLFDMQVSVKKLIFYSWKTLWWKLKKMVAILTQELFGPRK